VGKEKAGEDFVAYVFYNRTVGQDHIQIEYAADLASDQRGSANPGPDGKRFGFNVLEHKTLAVLPLWVPPAGGKGKPDAVGVMWICKAGEPIEQREQLNLLGPVIGKKMRQLAR